MPIPRLITRAQQEAFAQQWGIPYESFREQYASGALPPSYASNVEDWLRENTGDTYSATGQDEQRFLSGSTSSGVRTGGSEAWVEYGEDTPEEEEPSGSDTPTGTTTGSTRTTTRSTSGSTTPATPGDGNHSITEAPDVHGIPTNGELWNIEGTQSVAYQTEDGGPWIYYTIPDRETLNTLFPNGAPRARMMGPGERDRLGAISPGSVYLLTDTLSDNWEEGFNATIEREATIKPWLRDPEVEAALLAATLEGRTPTRADLEATEYFRSRSDAEVTHAAFMETASEREIEQYFSRFEDTVRNQLQDAGMRDPDDTLVNFIARKWGSAQWNDPYAARQIVALANPFSSVEMDTELKEFTQGMEFDTLRGQTEQVKAEVRRWLGPQHGTSYSEEWYQQWAGAIMDDPNAENDLIDHLQGQRMALYPEYTNPNLTYEDISGVWKGEMQRQWGVDPSDDRHWSVLDRVIRANDSTKAGRILREEGLNLDIGKVKNEAINAFGQNVGDQVVRSF